MNTCASRRHVSLAACVAVLAAIALAATGCAPVPKHVVPVDRDELRLRHDRALASREAHGRFVTADVALWLSFPGRGKLPGTSGRLLLAAPDAFRLQLASALGTALDLCARGDTLTGYAPGERIALDLAHASDSLGVREPGRLMVRAWSASWRPPEGSWERARRSDSLTRIAWAEGSDSVEVALGANGLPREVRLRGATGKSITARYLAWTFIDKVAWPASLEVEDAGGGFHLRARVSRARFEKQLAAARLRVQVPARAERVTVAQLIERFEAW